MKPCARPKICSGALRHRVTVERRSLDAPIPGSAEAGHTYTVVLTTRAEIKTKQGVSEFNRVEINGTRVSHVMTIRATTVAIDIRDRVRDSAGNLYAILSVEDIDQAGDFFKLYCARQGADTRSASL